MVDLKLFTESKHLHTAGTAIDRRQEENGEELRPKGWVSEQVDEGEW
jgi:hypothetical protein